MGVIARLAGPADDAALGRLLSGHVLPGSIRLRRTTEPSFLASLAVTGRQPQTILGDADGTIVSCATRSLLPLHDGGAGIPAGRLANLHIAPSHRGRLLARGFAALRRLHADGAAACYLTTVMEDNLAALAVLTSARAGLPTYADLGRVVTRILPAGHTPGPSTGASGLVVRRADDDAVQIVLDLLAATARRRSVVPAYTADEIRSGCGLLTGLGLDNLLLAWRDGRPVGCLGLWDQRPFRQLRVVGYAPWLGLLRPVWNRLAPWLNRPRLPDAGAATAYAFAALPLVPDDDPQVFTALLAAQLAQAAADGLDGMVVALHASDPLTAVLAKRPGWTLHSRLFAVHWDDGVETVRRLARQIPYIEAGAL